MEQIPPLLQLPRWLKTKQSGLISFMPFFLLNYSLFPFDTTMFHIPPNSYTLTGKPLQSTTPFYITMTLKTENAIWNKTKELQRMTQVNLKAVH
jgi:hypothetical protein